MTRGQPGDLRGSPDPAGEPSGGFRSSETAEAEVARLRRELADARRQQAASSDVLRTISSASFDLNSVLQRLTVVVTDLCEADMASIARQRGDGFHHVAAHNFPPGWVDANVARSLHADRGSAIGRALLLGKVVQIEDVLADPEYTYLDMQQKAGFRACLAVPLLREGVPIGAFLICRRTPQPFTERQIELVAGFADQAVIAIENARLFDEVQSRTHDLGEALERQTATSEVLGVISRSKFDIQPVLDTICQTARALCHSESATIVLEKGGKLLLAATANVDPTFVTFLRAHPQAIDRGTVMGRAILERRTIQIEDAARDPEYTWSEGLKAGRFRTLLGVPLLRSGEPIGAIILHRTTVSPYTEKQIELVTTFADQAVIAIENVRLFDEVQARTLELGESLERQTATSEVLGVISRSKFDIQPVLDTIVRTAARLCQADAATIYRTEGATHRMVAQQGLDEDAIEYRRQHPIEPGRGSVTGRAMLERRAVHVPDILSDPEFTWHSGQRTGRARSVLSVPLLRAGELLGTISVFRRDVRPFTEKQIELVTTFADQAVIAVENVRLFEEVQARTRELSEALEQQTATSDVLNVISRSTTDLQPVLDAIARTAGRLCRAEMAEIIRFHKDEQLVAAHWGFSPEAIAFLKRNPPLPDAGSLTGRVLLLGRTVHIADCLADPSYTWREGQAVLGNRAMLGVPLLRGGEIIGLIALMRRQPEPYTDKQIELVTTFADQAVIAIENVRLFDEVQARTRELTESLERQTATSEVLAVISKSKFDIQPVLDTIVATAARLCQAENGGIYLWGPEHFDMVAFNGDEATREYLLAHPIPHGRGTMTGRAFLEKRTIHLPDCLADKDYDWSGRDVLGNRSGLAVPLMRGDDVLGCIALIRRRVAPYTDKQIELVTTFADQAVIAIENVRLFEEVQRRTRELSEALEQQTATSEVLGVISRSKFDIQPVLDTIVATAARLCQAELSHIYQAGDDGYRMVAYIGHSEEARTYLEQHPIQPGGGSATGRVLVEGRVVHIPDVLADPDYQWREGQKVVGNRSVLGVPLLRDGKTIGAILLARRQVQPFTDKQIDLVSTFADQAVIAIENVRLFEEVQARTRELTESLERQTATSEVLGVISRSKFDIQPVLDTIVVTAARLCNAELADIARHDGKQYQTMAMYGYDDASRNYLLAHPVPPDRGSLQGRVLLEKRTVHIPDCLEDPNYRWREGQKILRQRSMLGVPLLRDGDIVGAITLMRRRVEPFSDKQIELVTTFADQAVIAIENVRLFDEVQARTRELTESLERQTATSEVLGVISRSKFDIQPVLDTIVQTAARLCQAEMAVIYQFVDDEFRVVAHAGDASALDYLRQHPLRAGRGTVTGRVLLEGRAIHVPDVLADPDYTWRVGQESVRHRTILGVPLLRDGKVMGSISVTRSWVEPFTEKQIDLITTFADQAVIAIENVRLFDEVQARTRDLSESLQQQTATAEVLKIISRSAFDLKTVLQTLIESAARLCEADKATITRRVGGVLYRAESYGFSAESMDYMSKLPVVPERKTIGGRVLLEGRIVHVADVWTDPDYSLAEIQKADPYHTVLGVPMLREGEVIGVMVLTRAEVRPFTEKQIELVSTFADQAAIAIENVRLFDEVQARTRDLSESLQQQTATADVLKIISRSTFDLQVVLQTLVESAAKLCDADKAVITRRIDGVLYRAESYGFSPEFMAYMRTLPITPERGTISSRVLLEGRTVHIHDVWKDPDYRLNETQKYDVHHTALGVPLIREGEVIGVMVLTRADVRPFTEKQIELVSTFADQAAIAIENARLFESEQQRTRELGRSLEELRAAQDRLVQTEKLASLGQLTAGIAHEIKNPLNFINNFGQLSSELIGELGAALADAPLDEGRRGEIEELSGMLRGNLEKVVQHGKRADSIVKNMLLHSRQGAGERRLVDVNAVVEESLNLAYHGARAAQRDFNVTLERAYDPAAGGADIYPQEITRVLLNLIGNGFYAVTKRKAQGEPGYEPTLLATTHDLGASVEIRVRDNGTGIPPHVRERLFTPFFTTKPAGEGTGLGLSLSHDIVVKQHGGSMEVESVPGEFTEFRIVLPRRAASDGKGSAA